MHHLVYITQFQQLSTFCQFGFIYMASFSLENFGANIEYVFVKLKRPYISAQSFTSRVW